MNLLDILLLYILIVFDYIQPPRKKDHTHTKPRFDQRNTEREREQVFQILQSPRWVLLSPHFPPPKTLIFPAPITSFFRSSSTYRIFYVSIFVYVLTHMHQFFLFILYAIDVGFCWWVLIICLIRGKKIQEEMGNSVAFEDYKFLFPFFLSILFIIYLPVFIQSHTSVVIDICIEYDMVNYKPSLITQKTKNRTKKKILLFHNNST